MHSKRKYLLNADLNKTVLITTATTTNKVFMKKKKKLQQCEKLYVKKINR